MDQLAPPASSILIHLALVISISSQIALTLEFFYPCWSWPQLIWLQWSSSFSNVPMVDLHRFFNKSPSTISSGSSSSLLSLSNANTSSSSPNPIQYHHHQPASLSSLTFVILHFSGDVSFVFQRWRRPIPATEASAQRAEPDLSAGEPPLRFPRPRFFGSPLRWFTGQRGLFRQRRGCRQALLQLRW